MQEYVYSFYEHHPCGNKPVMEVDTIAIVPGFQGRGFGSLLLKEVQSAAEGGGCGYIETTVDPRNNASIGNFLSQNYEVIKVIDAYSDAGPDYIYDVVPHQTDIELAIKRYVLAKKL